MQASSTWFQRFLLPGFAFKALVIGGGYATGRELVTFFLPAGPRGGLYAMFLSMLIWSVLCVLTFLFALTTHSRDYRAFFRQLLGPFWPAFEIVYALALIVILAVYAAAAGAIGAAVFGWNSLIGSLLWMGGITVITAWGNEAVERLFKYVTFLLYGTYIVFVGLLLARFGDKSAAALSAPLADAGWVQGGFAYAGYNLLGAVLILPVVRHLTSRRDALIAGALAGPMAMVPAILFFLCMIAFYPQIANEALPSDFLLRQLNLPALRVLFELMIFMALLESAVGGVHAVNERIAHSYSEVHAKPFPRVLRVAVTCAVLGLSVFVAARFGLVQLIASGYQWIAYAILLIYGLPLITFGVWRIRQIKAVG